jgi:hypothetical protein
MLCLSKWFLMPRTDMLYMTQMNVTETVSFKYLAKTSARLVLRNEGNLRYSTAAIGNKEIERSVGGGIDKRRCF